MKQEELRLMIADNLSINEISRKTGKSYTTVRYWLKKYELRTNHRQYNKKDIRECRLCGKIQFKDLCGSCRTRVRRYLAKKAAVSLLGGKCQMCSKKVHLAGFEFHHSGKDKEFAVGTNLNKRWSVVKKEVSKCQLLCSICHRIVHATFDDEDFQIEVKRSKARFDVRKLNDET